MKIERLDQQVVVRTTKDLKAELRDEGHKYAMRISDFARVALAEGLRKIKERGTITSRD